MLGKESRMQKSTLILGLATLFLATGCTATHRIVGHNGVHVGDWYGELGITGHVNNVTIKSGSRLDKLSIIGDMNKVFVEDRVVLGKIEVWGENNEIQVPERLIVRDYRVGKGNQIIRREPSGTIDVVGPNVEVLEGQDPAAYRYRVVPTPAHANDTPVGSNRVAVQPASPTVAPQAQPPGSMEILEVQPAPARESLQPGVHNSNENPNGQNQPK